MISHFISGVRYENDGNSKILANNSCLVIADNKLSCISYQLRFFGRHCSTFGQKHHSMLWSFSSFLFSRNGKGFLAVALLTHALVRHRPPPV